ncbi:MAG: hypothetical protein V1916_00585 [Patescibacteria group bacterium]
MTAEGQSNVDQTVSAANRDGAGAAQTEPGADKNLEVPPNFSILPADTAAEDQVTGGGAESTTPTGTEDSPDGAEPADTSLWQRFKESVVVKKLKGEVVADKEMGDASKLEKIALITGKAVDIASSMVGVRMLTRLPDRVLKRHFRTQEINAFRAIIDSRTADAETGASVTAGELPEPLPEGAIETEAPTTGESPAEGGTVVERTIQALEQKLASSKYLTQEKRQLLTERIAAIQSEYESGSAENLDTLFTDMGSAIKEHVGEKTKKVELFRDSLNLVGTATGMYAFRAVGMGLAMSMERADKVLGEMKRGERKNTLPKYMKGIFVDSVTETAQEMFGKGKLKKKKIVKEGQDGTEQPKGELTDEQRKLNRGENIKKTLGVISAWGKSITVGAIALAGLSEVGEKGAGAFSMNLDRLSERGEEIGKAWDQLSESASPADALKLIGETLNIKETLHRMTHNIFKGEHAGRELAAAGVGVPVPPETLDTLPPTETATDSVTPDTGTVAAQLPEQPTPDYSTQLIGNALLREIPADESLVHDTTPLPAEATDTVPTPIELKPATPATLNELGKALYENDQAKVSTVLGEFKVDPEIQQQLASLTMVEKTMGINSFDGQLEPADLEKLSGELTTGNAEAAKAMLENYADRGLITPEQQFGMEHATLEHAGFKAGVVATEAGAEHPVVKNVTIELGAEGAPEHLEQVFDRMAVDNMDIGKDLDNVEAARVLNIGANLRELSAGHSVAGVEASTFQQYATMSNGKLEVTDYDDFRVNVLNKLTTHAEQTITLDNIGQSGAVAYINNIKEATWADMVEPKGVAAEHVQFDQAAISQAEHNLFGGALTKAGIGDLATNVEITSEDNGSFAMDSQTFLVEHGQVTAVNGQVVEEPINLSGDGAKEKLLQYGEKAHAEKILTMQHEAAERLNARLGEINRTPELIIEPPPSLELKYDTSVAMRETLHQLGLDRGQGVKEWDFLKKQSVDDLLNKKISWHAGNRMDFLEGRHRGKLRELVQHAINNAELKPPNAGGPKTIGEAMDELVQKKTGAQVRHDLAVAEAIVAHDEKITGLPPAAGTGTDTLGDQTREAAASVATSTTETSTPVQPEVTGGRSAASAAAESAAGSTETLPASPTVTEAALANVTVEPVAAPTAEHLADSVVQEKAAEAHFETLTGHSYSGKRFSELDQESLVNYRGALTHQVDGLTKIRESSGGHTQKEIDTVVAGYQSKMHQIDQRLSDLASQEVAPVQPDTTTAASEAIPGGTKTTTEINEPGRRGTITESETQGTTPSGKFTIQSKEVNVVTGYEFNRTMSGKAEDLYNSLLKGEIKNEQQMLDYISTVKKDLTGSGELTDLDKKGWSVFFKLNGARSVIDRRQQIIFELTSWGAGLKK